MENKLKSALVFSGGGHRIATFHLSVLSAYNKNTFNR